MRYSEFGDFLVSAALYGEETIEDGRVTDNNGSLFLDIPRIVERECPDCGMTKWEIMEGQRIGTGFHALRYRCRNCATQPFQVWLVWWWDKGARVMKAGQYPKLEVTIPKEFEKALGTKRSLYLKGMTSRHNGYGIGALTYLRRLIEDTTDEMLSLLEEAMEGVRADPAAIEALRRAKDGRRFEDKVKMAAEVMPAHLKPGGINPFGDLYELLSIGLHDRSDGECCDIVDAMDKSLKFIYTQLKTHAEDSKAYEQATKSIHELLAKWNGRDPKQSA